MILGMSISRHVSLFAIQVFAFMSSCGVSDNPVLESPDGNVVVKYSGNLEDGMYYSVSYCGQDIMGDSKLGVVPVDGMVGKDAVTSIVRDSHDEVWNQPWGENKKVLNRYNEMAVTNKDASGNWMTVRFRAFDDGIAFRYEWNIVDAQNVVVTDELTEFKFSQDGMSWSIPGNFETYELNYRHMPLSEVEDANTPFTFCTSGGHYGAIHEAALYDYPEMTLKRDSTGILKAELAPMPDGIKADVPNMFVTPWRTLQLGKKPVDLINSELILNLNEPSKIGDVSWIKPQKYVGVWWGMHLGTQTWTMGSRHGVTTENALRHIDFAAANNIQGVLFEGWNVGWENWGGNQHFDYLEAYPDFDIERVARYAKEKGIELWMHNETGGNIPEYEAALDSALAYYESIGVHTLKTGYAGGFVGGYYHHSQYGVRHYQRVVEACASHKIMLDAHEPIKETGIRRTWPNMMTREGARGMEWNAWSEGNSSEYLCTLPYVRLLSGPMDYTPGIFDIDYSTAKADKGRIEWNGPNGDCCIKTTLARQIANWVIIYSPLQMAADLIENYEGHPAFQFFRDFDADCDWSRAVCGEIGQYIVVARRAGDNFYVGAGTNGEARTLPLSLDFLDPGMKYKATIYGDKPGSVNPEDYIIEALEVDVNSDISIVMNENGGQAITLTPIR